MSPPKFDRQFTCRPARSTSILSLGNGDLIMRQTLNDQEWQTFQEEGYVELGRLIANDELHALQKRIDEIMMGTADVPYDRIMMQLDTTTGKYKDMTKQTKGHKGATLAYRKMQGLEFDPLFLAYMQKPLFRDISERAYGTGIPISVFRAMFINKPARQGTVLPWHQDYFLRVDRPPITTVWMAMDNSTIENGCVKILPGSHLHYEEDDPTVFLKEEQIEEVLAKYNPEMLECEAGEGYLLHNRVLHTSAVNSTNQPRRAFSACYMDGRAKQKDDTGFSIIFGEGAMKPEMVGAAG